MPHSPPPEAPHYNGNTLSPASPRPIHIPEAQNIPVLQNQIDPVFNLVATHMEGPKEAQGPAQIIQPADLSGSTYQDTSGGSDPLAQLKGQTGGHAINEMSSNGSIHERADQNLSTNHPNTDHTFTSRGAPDFPSTPAQSNMMSFTHNQSRDQPTTASTQLASASPPNSTDDPSSHQMNPTAIGAQAPPPVPTRSPNKDLSVDTGNIQALLDNLIASASSTTQAEHDSVSAPTHTSSVVPQASSPNSVQTPISALPTPAGLPPRPPPQDEPAIHPNYTPGQSIRSYHNPPPPATASNSSAQSHSSYRPSQNYIPSNTAASNGMPPPPPASFQQSPSQQSTSPQEQQQRDEFGRTVGRPDLPMQNDSSQSQVGPDRDRAYEDFLRDEAIYVAEGTWDRFPQGSRLFVGRSNGRRNGDCVADKTPGNLFTEKVSKRHIFDVFSRYGRLAQISMKNAYGFVQFIDPGCSNRAMQAEEGTELGGRKIRMRRNSELHVAKC